MVGVCSGPVNAIGNGVIVLIEGALAELSRVSHASTILCPGSMTGGG